MMFFDHGLLWLVALSLSAWLYLLLGRSGFWRTRPLLERLSATTRDPPDVVAVVPARDEAACVGRALRSLLGQDYPGRLSVILVDDHSEDATRAIAQAVPVPPGRSLTVIAARPLPRGWSGKLWALSEGLGHASRCMPGACYVLLTDADIAHDPGNLRRLVAKADAEGLDLVSLMVRLHCEHFWERLLIPPFVFFFRKLYPFAAVNRQDDPVAAAAGGCALVRRTALARIGGIEAIRDQLIDDVALARRIKHHPLPSSGQIWLGLTESTRSLRRQTRLCELWAMIARCADAQLEHSLARLGLTTVAMLTLYLAPPLAVIAWPLHGDEAIEALGLAAWLCMTLAYLPTVRLYRLPPHWTLTLPLAAGLYTAMTMDSAWRHRRGKGGQWKGRIAPPAARRSSPDSAG
ncbi:MAG TPA: glycosyltransferase [Geminicoccaceae bacterium]|nr:glycosyltransferase [Geminicoccaceae bacterium]